MKYICDIVTAVRRAATTVAIALAAVQAGHAGAEAPSAALQLSDDNAVSTSRLQHIGERLKLANPQLCRLSSSRCTGRLIASPSNNLNAWADGRNIVITQRMMRFANVDDELAFVVAHEMAHNFLGHAAVLKTSTALFGLGSKHLAERTRHLEIEADALAVTLMAKAGFDPAVSARFVARSMHGRSRASRTHPGTSERLDALRTAMREQTTQLL